MDSLAPTPGPPAPTSAPPGPGGGGGRVAARVGLVLPLLWLALAYTSVGSVDDRGWRAGIALGTAGAIGAAATLRRLRADGKSAAVAAALGPPASPDVQAEADALADRLGVRRCAVRVSLNHPQVASCVHTDDGAVIAVDAEVASWTPPLRQAVVAHELAHTRHRRSSAGAAAALAAAALAVAVAPSGWTTAGIAVAWGCGVGVLAAVLRGRRRDEYAADAAVTAAVPELADTLAATLAGGVEVGRGWRWLATHPDPSQRIAAIRRRQEPPPGR